MSAPSSSQRPISSVMQSGVATVTPNLNVAAFQEFLTAEEISGAPVVDHHGALCGIASKTDIITLFTEDRSLLDEDALQDVMVEDIMSPHPISVSVDDEIGEVARTMVEARVHRVLVVEDEQIRGIVTTFDLLPALYS
jgi:CBS domain-containing protein